MNPKTSLTAKQRLLSLRSRLLAGGILFALLLGGQSVSAQVLTNSIIDLRTKLHFHDTHEWRFHPGDSPKLNVDRLRQIAPRQKFSQALIDKWRSGEELPFVYALPRLPAAYDEGWIDDFHVQWAWDKIPNPKTKKPYFPDFDRYKNKYNGYGWYRTTFDVTSKDLTERFGSEELVLRLGAIGQADAVYLNGHYLEGTGLTEGTPPEAQLADKKLLYGKLRYYRLPLRHLNLNKPNTLAVRVYAKYNIAPGLSHGKYYVASQHRTNRDQFWDHARKITVIVLAVLLGVFYLYWQFIFRSEERATFYFALAAFAMAINALARSQIIFDIWAHGLWVKKIEYMSLIAIIHLLTVFVVRFSRLRNRLVLRLYYLWIALGYVAILTVLILPSLGILTSFMYYWAVAPILVFFFLAYVMIKGRRIPAMGMVSIGIIVLVLSLANDALLQFQFGIVTWEVYWTDYGFAILSLTMAFSIVSNMVNSHEIIEKQEKEKEQLSRYFSPDVMETIIRENISLGGEEKEIVTLFADIVGFTSFSEQQPPGKVLKRLNELFEALAEDIFQYKATLDKFIGDSVMAFWGAPKSSGRDAYLAVSCALKMQEAIQKLSKSLPEDEPGFQLRIGLNMGASIVGNVGSEKRMDYTVIGDAVNIASRIEAQSFPGGVTVSQSVFDAAGGEAVLAYSEKRTLRVKGKEKELVVYDITQVKA